MTLQTDSKTKKNLRTTRDRNHQPRHADRRVPSFYAPSENASSSRLVRRQERWSGLAEASKLAQITVLEHGGHERPIITRGGKHLRSRMGSRKTGLQQVVEGRGHRDLTMFNDVHPNVLDFNAHPFKICFQVSGVRHTYYPDHIRLLRDGTIELIEVKRSPADLGDAEYRTKLAAVAEIARRVGWTFRILYHEDITGPRWRMRNVQAIYMRRFMALTRTEQAAISSFVAGGHVGRWVELREKVCPGDGRRGEAALQCAIALGRIEIDFDARITDDTLVTPCVPVPSRRGFRI